MELLALTLLSLTERFSLSIERLCQAVAERSVGGWLETSVIILIRARIRRIERRFLVMVAAIRAGRLRGGWVIAGRVAGARGAARTASPSVRLPRRFAWLVVLVPYEAAGYASQLRHLLGEPEMVALLAATPRLGKVLRPLCRMLGIEGALLSPKLAVAMSGLTADEGVSPVSAAKVAPRASAVVPTDVAAVSVLGEIHPQGWLFGAV